MRLVTRGPEWGGGRQELNSGGYWGHKPGFRGVGGVAEALRSRRTALTLELGHEGLALETDGDVNAFLPLAAA